MKATKALVVGSLLYFIYIPSALGETSSIPPTPGVIGHYFADLSYQNVKKVESNPAAGLTWSTPFVTPLDGKNFWVEWEGQIRIPKTGDYTFQVAGDADGFVYVDGKRLFQRLQGFLKGPFKVSLEAGFHRLRSGAVTNRPSGRVSLQWKANANTQPSPAVF